MGTHGKYRINASLIETVVNQLPNSKVLINPHLIWEVLVHNRVPSPDLGHCYEQSEYLGGISTYILVLLHSNRDILGDDKKDNYCLFSIKILKILIIL